jgi:hypothetical protein
MTRHRRRKECGKVRWPSMKAAHAFCFHKRHVGVNIRPYWCGHCKGIHVGHFRQDDLPAFEVTMAKTRVYSIFSSSGRSRIGCIHLSKETVLEELAYYQGLRVMEKEINEQEYAELSVHEMQQQHHTDLPDDGSVISENRHLAPPDSWMNDSGWRDSDPPEPPMRRSRK